MPPVTGLSSTAAELSVTVADLGAVSEWCVDGSIALYGRLAGARIRSDASYRASFILRIVSSALSRKSLNNKAASS